MVGWGGDVQGTENGSVLTRWGEHGVKGVFVGEVTTRANTQREYEQMRQG